ncbi:unnamed protein product [Gadus morhua 'NCC']
MTPDLDPVFSPRSLRGPDLDPVFSPSLQSQVSKGSFPLTWTQSPVPGPKGSFPLTWTQSSVPGLVSSDTQPPPVSGRLEEGLSLGPVCRCAGDLLPVLQVRARRPEGRSARQQPPIGQLRLPPGASKIVDSGEMVSG